MSSENRRFPRVEVRSGQMIAYHSFLPPGTCMLLDYGLGGARCLLQTQAMNEVAARSWLAALELGANLELELVSISKKRIRASVRHSRMISDDLAVFGLQFRADDTEACAALDCGLRVFEMQSKPAASPSTATESVAGTEAATESAPAEPATASAPAEPVSGPQPWPAAPDGSTARADAPAPAPETAEASRTTQRLRQSEVGVQLPLGSDSRKAIGIETTRVAPVGDAPEATRPLRRGRFTNRIKNFFTRVLRRSPPRPNFRQLRLGEIFIHFYEANATQVEDLMARARRKNMRLGEFLIAEKILTRQELLNMLVLQSGLPSVRLSLQNSGRMLRYLPLSVCEKFNVAPFNYKERTLYVACTRRLNEDEIQQLQAASKSKIKLFVTSDYELQMFLAAR